MKKKQVFKGVTETNLPHILEQIGDVIINHNDGSSDGVSKSLERLRSIKVEAVDHGAITAGVATILNDAGIEAKLIAGGRTIQVARKRITFPERRKK